MFIAGGRFDSGVHIGFHPARLGADERVEFLLLMNCGVRSVTRHHRRRIIEAEQLSANRFDYLVEAAAPEIRAPDAVLEQRIA